MWRPRWLKKIKVSERPFVCIAAADHEYNINEYNLNSGIQWKLCTLENPYKENEDKMEFKVKENGELDLSTNVNLPKPVKCWVRDYDDEKWHERWLFVVRHNLAYCIRWKNKTEAPSVYDAAIEEINTWSHCRLTKPATYKKPWKTVHDVPPELWGKAWIKNEEMKDSFALLMTPLEASDQTGEIRPYLVYSTDANPIGATWKRMES